MEPTNVPAFFFAQAARLGNRTWLHHHPDGDWRTITWEQGATGVSRIAAEPAEADAAEVERRLGRLGRDDLATIVYTSGTTGEPKGAMLAHRNLVDMADSSLAAIHVGEEDVILSALPYAHVFERVSSVCVGIRAGATIWISRGVDRLVDDVAAARPTVILGVPRIFEK